MRLQITFKSGAHIEFDVEDFSVNKDRLSGGIAQLKWNTPAVWKKKLQWINVEEVVAVVVDKSRRSTILPVTPPPLG